MMRYVPEQSVIRYGWAAEDMLMSTSERYIVGSGEHTEVETGK